MLLRLWHTRQSESYCPLVAATRAWAGLQRVTPPFVHSRTVPAFCILQLKAERLNASLQASLEAKSSSPIAGARNPEDGETTMWAYCHRSYSVAILGQPLPYLPAASQANGPNALSSMLKICLEASAREIQP